jgi:hypothetical protein
LWSLLEFGDQYAVECLEIYATSGVKEALNKARRFRQSASCTASQVMSEASGSDFGTVMNAWARNLASSAVWRATAGPPTRSAMAWEDAARAIGSAEAAASWQPDTSPPAIDWQLMSASELAIQAALLRDIFGNPFRPVAFDPRWRTSTAIGLARTMYESRDFAAMPVLADALEEAGCDSPDVSSHCRGPGPHVRGCWVVDRVLDKS